MQAMMGHLWGRRLLPAIGICVLALGNARCGDTTASGDADVDVDTDADCDADTDCVEERVIIAWLGDPQRTVRPGAQLTIKAALVNTVSGPLASQDLAFEIVGNAIGSQLSATTARTAATGVAEIDLSCTTSPTQFQVRASHPEAENDASMTISVEVAAKKIVLITDANLSLQLNQVKKLTAKLIDDDSKLPLVGEELSFAFQQPFANPGNATLDGGAGPVVGETNGLGRVDVMLGTGSAETTFRVVVSTPDAADATFEIEVHEASQTDTCRFDQDCEDGQFCEDGECKDRDTGCQDDLDCAFGETCDSGVCVPDCDPAVSDCCVMDQDCPEDQYCDNGECTDMGAECITNADCDAGYICRSGVCIEPTTYKIDVSGEWDVQSRWNLDKLLDKETRIQLEGIFETLEEVESYLNFDFIRDEIPMFGDFIADFIISILPEEIQIIYDIVYGANDIIAAFEELQIHSTMTLTQRNPPATAPQCETTEAAALIRGKDAWWGLTFWWRGACGDLLDCQEHTDPDFPYCECAQVDLDLEEMDVRVLSSQFDGCVERRNAPADDFLILHDHESRLNWGEIVRYLLEEVILDAIAGVNSFEDLFAMVIDCADIGSWVDSEICSGFGISCARPVETACTGGLNALATALRTYLNNLDTGLDQMTYRGYAKIVAFDEYAEELGPPEPTMGEPFGTGRWTGEIITDPNTDPPTANRFTSKWTGIR